jgi:hypothetical protein
MMRRAIRQHALSPSTRLTCHVPLAGPTPRGEFMTMTGLPERTASRVLAQLVKDGLLASAGPKSAVWFNFPLDALHILLPNLYPEAAAANTEI